MEKQAGRGADAPVFERSCAELVGEALRPLCRTALYKAGETIVYAGQPLREAGFIEAGSATGVSYLPGGGISETFRMDAQYGVIGLAELLGGQSSIQYTVAAAQQTRVLFLPIAAAQEQLLTDAGCMRRYAQLLTRGVVRYNLHAAMYRRSAEEKFRYYLCYVCNGRLVPGGSMTIAASYREIAGSLGISTQSVYRAARSLTAQGLLGRQGGRVSVSYAQYAQLLQAL